MLCDLVVVLVDEGMVAVQSTRELADVLQHHFSIYKHEFQVYCSHPKHFIAIFSETFARDRVFAAGRIVDEPVALRVHAWDLDRFGDRASISFNVKLSLEGIP